MDIRSRVNNIRTPSKIYKMWYPIIIIVILVIKDIIKCI